MRNCEEKEERLMLLESWRDFEKEFGTDSTRERVRKLLPEKVKKRRKLTAEDGVRDGQCHSWMVTATRNVFSNTDFFFFLYTKITNGLIKNLIYNNWIVLICPDIIPSHQSDAGWEEYYDYIFPEDAANQPNLKLLAMAKMWKKQQVITEDDETLPENGPPAAEETTKQSVEAAASPENRLTTASSRETAAETEQEKTYDDRDDDNDSSSSESEEEEKGGERKESRSSEEDKE